MIVQKRRLPVDDVKLSCIKMVLTYGRLASFLFSFIQQASSLF